VLSEVGCRDTVTSGFIHKLWAVERVDRRPSLGATSDAVGSEAFIEGALAAAKDLRCDADEPEYLAGTLNGALAVAGHLGDEVDGWPAVAASAVVSAHSVCGGDFIQGLE
jgi:hypothetical protein